MSDFKGGLRAVHAIFVAVALLLGAAADAASGERVFCKGVIDGDTFYADGKGKVRLIGVDAPELGHDGKPDEPGAREAKRFLEAAIKGKFVELDYDETRTDKYGRILAYVTTPEGVSLNEELLKRGLAEPIRHLPYKKKAAYMKLWKRNDWERRR